MPSKEAKMDKFDCRWRKKHTIEFTEKMCPSCQRFSNHDYHYWYKKNIKTTGQCTNVYNPTVTYIDSMSDIDMTPELSKASTISPIQRSVPSLKRKRLSSTTFEPQITSFRKRKRSSQQALSTSRNTQNTIQNDVGLEDVISHQQSQTYRKNILKGISKTPNHVSIPSDACQNLHHLELSVV